MNGTSRPVSGSAELALRLNSSRSSAEDIRFKLSQTTSEADLALRVISVS